MHHRLVTFAALMSLVFAIPVLAEGPALQPGDRLGICGDSITEQRLYSVFIEDYLLMCKPVENVRTTQFGYSGDTSWGFVGSKLDNDVLRFHPTVATTCFGMNDGGYASLNDVTADRYRSSAQAIISKMKAAGVRTIILGSPGSVGAELKGRSTDANGYNQTLSKLRDIDMQIAKKNGILFADVFTPMIQVTEKAQAKYGKDYQVNGKDGIHPDENGHLIMAYAFLRAMGFDGNISTFTVDLSTNKATASEGNTMTSDVLKDGIIEINSSRYPFCFTGDPKQTSATTGIIEFLPFNQELNRLTLIVTNAPAARMKITWGSASKEFSSTDLTRGINLAAEFLDNPFSQPFAKVHNAVKAQQNFETAFIKGFLFNLPSYESAFDQSDKTKLEEILSDETKKDDRLFATAASIVMPVHHTIKIEAVK